MSLDYEHREYSALLASALYSAYNSTMKKCVYALTVIIFSITGLLFGTLLTQFPTEAYTLISPITVSSEATPGTPSQLIIPSLRIQASVEQVGIDKKGAMDVPKNVYNVAWYQPGSIPGAIGNAVINGHVDTPTGKPSVFYGIKMLKTGDLIYIKDKNNKMYKFVVTDTTSYNTNEVPLEYIFGSNEISSKLFLITCGGIYDTVQKDYTKRVVVTALHAP